VGLQHILVTPPKGTNLRGPLWRRLAWNEEWRFVFPGQALRRDAG
jgi:hypothetical protein